MKSVLISMLAAAITAVPLEPRQMAGMTGMGSANGGIGDMIDKIAPLLANPAAVGLISNFIPKKDAVKIEELKPQLGRAGAKRVRITYGPYKLKGKNDKKKFGNTMSMDPAGDAYNYLAATDFPRDITVLHAGSHIALENGKRAEDTDGVYLHHTVFFDFSNKVRQYVGCADPAIKPVGQVPVSVFMAGATETGSLWYTSKDGSYNSGYYVGPKDVIYNGIDAVNYNNDTLPVYTINEMEYIPGKAKDADVAMQQTINLGQCSGTNGIDVRPTAGQKTMTVDGKGLAILEDGVLINTRGHLHDGGKNMVVLINGKEVCNSVVEYGGPGYEYTLKDGSKIEAIRATSECGSAIPVKKGDKLDITAHFDFAAHPQRESAGGEMAEGMALLVTTFVSNDKL